MPIPSSLDNEKQTQKTILQIKIVSCVFQIKAENLKYLFILNVEHTKNIFSSFYPLF